MRRRLVIVLALVCGLGALLVSVPWAGAEQTRASSPQDLYQALLTKSITSAQLPSGFYSVSTGVSQPSGTAKKHHVVGEVAVSIDSETAGILYAIFPSPKDAFADWKDADISHHQGAKTQIAAPKSFPRPATIVNGSLTGNNVLGKKVTNGFTYLAFEAGSVNVAAFTLSTTNTQSGDVPATIKLATLAFSHLRTTEARLTGGSHTKTKTKPKPQTPRIGDSITLRSSDEWLRVTLLKFKNPAKPTNQYSTPDAGKKFVAVYLRLRNLEATPYTDSPSNGAKLISTAHVAYSATLSGLEPDIDQAGPIPRSDYRDGWLTFEVPKNVHPWKLQFVLNSGFADQIGVWLLR